MVVKKTVKKASVSKVLKSGTKKKLMGTTPVEVVQDHGNGLVTVNVGGRYIVVRKNNLK